MLPGAGSVIMAPSATGATGKLVAISGAMLLPPFLAVGSATELRIPGVRPIEPPPPLLPGFETYGTLPVGIDPTAYFGRYYDPPISLDIFTTLQAIQTRLNERFASVGIDNIATYIWPDYDLDRWWKSTSPAFVLIAYRGTRYGPPLATDAMAQERTLEIAIVVIGRTASWDQGGPGSLYALVDGVEAILTGFRPTGWRDAFFTEERFTSEDPEGGVWLYEMNLELITIRVKRREDYVLANLAEIVNLIGDTAGVAPTTVVVPPGGAFRLPPSTMVVRVTGAHGEIALLGRDYTYDTASGLFQATSTGLLQPGDTIAITAAPSPDVQTIPFMALRGNS